MRVLSLDTAMNGCGVCVLETDTGAAQSKIEPMPRGQAERLIPMVQGVLQDGGFDFNALDLIAVTKGPGAFTGLRIGLACARAMGLALAKPVVGVCTFQAVFETFKRQNPLVECAAYGVLLETKRADYYVRFFDAQGAAQAQGQCLGAAQIKPLLTGGTYGMIGDAVARFAQETGWQSGATYQIDLPHPECIARIAANAYTDHPNACAAEPVYLRGADVTPPAPPARFIASGRKTD